jgi:hypothetical protein
MVYHPEYKRIPLISQCIPADGRPALTGVDVG